MKHNKMRIITIIATCVALFIAGFVGFAIANMTTYHSASGTSTEKEPASKTESEDPSKSESGSEPQSESESEEPSEPAIISSSRSIRELTPEEISEIRNTYRDETNHYTISPERDNDGIPLSVKDFSETVKGFDNIIYVTETDPNEVALFFILTENEDDNTAFLLTELSKSKLHATFFSSMDYADRKSVV